MPEPHNRGARLGEAWLPGGHRVARTMQIAKAIMTGLRVPLLTGLLLGTAGSMAWDGAYSAGVAGIYAARRLRC